jgi:hypothetical protein
VTKGKIIPFEKAASLMQKRRAKRFIKATCSHWPPAIDVGHWETGVAKFTCSHCGAVILPEDAWDMMMRAHEEIIDELIEENRELRHEVSKLMRIVKKRLSSEGKKKGKSK